MKANQIHMKHFIYKYYPLLSLSIHNLIPQISLYPLSREVKLQLYYMVLFVPPACHVI
jgi:hypothetical protein